MLTSNPCHADARYSGQTERRGGTVGFPLPGVSLRVQDDAGQPVPLGEIGGIQVKGPNVFGGYWRMPEKTAEEFTADGFFKTGDVGRIDERGYVTIVGPQQRPDHFRRLQRLSGRDRGLHQRIARRGRECPGRGAAPRLRRSGGCGGDCQTRCHGPARGRHCRTESQTGQFQDSQALLCRVGVATQHHGQSAEEPFAGPVREAVHLIFAARRAQP
jgi:hypothetical protein